MVREVSVRIGCGLSDEASALTGSRVAAEAARAGLGDDARVDLAVVFASGGHLAAPEAVLEGVLDVLAPDQLIGCGASGVVAGARELESETAVTVWAASFSDGGQAQVFHVRGDEEADIAGGLPALDGASGLILLPDPYSFATDVALGVLAERGPGVPVLGGLSSARTLEGAGALFLNDAVLEDGAVGAVLSGVELLPCVSQGAAPLGPELTITRAEGHVIFELAGQPALTKLKDVFEHMSEREQGLIRGGLLVGLVAAAGKPDYELGDFLVRGVLGADEQSGAISVGATVSEGQILRLHARDAATASHDLHEALALRRDALGEHGAAGALLFTCNGRGHGMFGRPDHDALAMAAALDGAPVAGFFAAGEIGPVGAGTFLHGFTATAAVFAA